MMITAFLDRVRTGNMIAPQLMAGALHLPMGDLAKLAHVHRNTLSTKATTPAVQSGLGAIARIISHAAALTGDIDRAIIWFRHQPLPGFDGKTAETLVGDGQAQAVTAYLVELEDGGYA